MIETTAALSGSLLRLTIDCIAWARPVAITIGSMPCCGIAACAPRPVMRMSKKSAAAIIGPVRVWNTPCGPCGALCSA